MLKGSNVARLGDKPLSLVGSLRDLSLGDIFQIVAMSRRSGTLQLVAGHYTGRVIFDDGKVVAADCQQDGKGTPLGERLIAKAIVPATVVTQIMAQEQQVAEQVAQGQATQIVDTAALLRAQQIELEKLEGPLQGLMLGLIQTMFAWREGHFSFVLHTTDTPALQLQLHHSLVVLQQGINPQFLAIEGARLEDEQEGPDHAPQALVDSPTPAPPATPMHGRTESQDAPSSQGEVIKPLATQGAFPLEGATYPVLQSTLLLIDDDPIFLEQLVQAMQPCAKQIVGLGSVVEALARIATATTPMVVLADLVMPGHDGQSVLGGLELLEYVHAHAPQIPVILFTDYASDSATQQAAQFGVQTIVRKPRKAQLLLQGGSLSLGPAMVQFTGKLKQMLLQCHDNKGQIRREKIQFQVEQANQGTGSTTPSSEQSLPSPLVELQTEIEELLSDAPWLRAEPMVEEPHAAVLTPLRAMLTELRDRSQADSISLLILRYASSLAERAALFLVTKWAYAGLGGFSPFFPAEQFVMRVRRLQLPVDHQSVFDKVVGFRTLWRAPLQDSPAHRALMAGLGGAWHPHDVVVAPLISNDRVAALLWCDNPSGKPLAAMDGMEIFLQQAGLVMDRIVLERKLAQQRDRANPPASS